MHSNTYRHFGKIGKYTRN